MKIAIAVSRFNEEVTSKLLNSCLKTLRAEGLKDSQLKVVDVPGGFELPWTVNELARSGKYTVVVALGCVLKGSTPQNEHISRSLVFQLHEISVATRVPVVLGVITPNTWEQAVARTKGKLDRGHEAALAALEMAQTRKELARG
jgi:6,7-dimethyl-8-ribityllumazine synthase